MPPRHLLLCFDAFGTLFTPKQPIPTQYAAVAHQLGITGFTESQLATSFLAAFRSESKRHPNYGKAAGLTPTRWWTNIISQTFSDEVVGPGTDRRVIEEALAPRLVERFSSGEGYVVFDDVKRVLRRVREGGGKRRKAVVGLITNSDDRAPDVLGSLGVRVSPVRFGGDEKGDMEEDGGWDVGFSVMSYDVGFEKPDKRIFGAAVDMLRRTSVSRGTDVDKDWDMVYVGDEYGKDVVGAVGAGWKAVLVDREGTAREKKLEGVTWLDETNSRTLEEAFTTTQAVAVRSLDELAQLMPAQTS